MTDILLPRRAALQLALGAATLPGFAAAEGIDPLLYGPTDPAAKRGGKVIIGSLVEPPAIDPFRQAADARVRVSVLIYQGLFFEDQTGVARPLLAESATTSADGKSLIVTLRRGVKFHTGAGMTSADVKYSLDFMRNPANGSPGGGDLSSVEAIEAPDAHTVVFRLSRPNAALPMALTNKYTVVVPRGFLDDPASGTRFNEVSVGTGPFRLKQFRPNATLTLERHAE